MYRCLDKKIRFIMHGLIAIFCLFSYMPGVFAFNEFQKHFEKTSNKQLNCALCHSHFNGPEGSEKGQLELLTEEEKELTAYNQYLSDNQELVDSPILNEFGNYLIKKLGYETIVEAQGDPDIIVTQLKDFDLDNDGISDAEELLDGTLPNDPLDGDPLKLFISNFKKNKIEIGFQTFFILLLILALVKLKSPI